MVRAPAGLFILDDRCPHQEQSLVGGDIEGSALVCPFHSVRIDLLTGNVLYDMGFIGLPKVRVFSAKEEQGRIFAGIPETC